VEADTGLEAIQDLQQQLCQPSRRVSAMSDTNQERKAQVQSKSNDGEKKGQASFSKFILNFILYFMIGLLFFTLIGGGK